MSLVGNFTFNNYDHQAEVAGAGHGRETAHIGARSQEDVPTPILDRMTSWRTAREDPTEKETKAVRSRSFSIAA